MRKKIFVQGVIAGTVITAGLASNVRATEEQLIKSICPGSFEAQCRKGSGRGTPLLNEPLQIEPRPTTEVTSSFNGVAETAVIQLSGFPAKFSNNS